MLKKKTNQEPNRNQTNETATGWPLRSIRLSLFLFCWAFSFIDSISSLFDGCRLVTGHGRRSWWLPAVNLRVLRPPLGPILSSSSTSWCCFFFYFFFVLLRPVFFEWVWLIVRLFVVAETPMSPHAEVSRPDDNMSVGDQRLFSLEKQLNIELKVSRSAIFKSKLEVGAIST